MKLNYKRTRNNSQFLYDLGNVYSTSDLINRLVNVDAIANVKSDAKSKETEGETEDANKAAFECTKLIVNGQVLYDLSVLKPIHDDLVNAAADLKSGEASDEEREEARVRFDAIDGYNKIFKSFARKLSQLPQELNHLPNEFVEITADGFNQSVEIKLNLEDYRRMLKNDAVAYQLSFKSASDRALVVAKLDDFADYEAKLAELIDDNIWQKMNPVKHSQEQLNDLLKAKSIKDTESTDNAEDAPKENADVKPSNGEAGAENAQTDNSKDAQAGNESSTDDTETAQSDSEEKSLTDDAENVPKENADAKPSDGENAHTDNSEDTQADSESSTNDVENTQLDDKDNSSTDDAQDAPKADEKPSTDDAKTAQSDGEEKSSINDAQDALKADEKSSDGENNNAKTAQSDGKEKASTDDAQDTPKSSIDEKSEDNLTKRLDEIEAKLSAPKTDDVVNTLAQVIMAFMKNNPAVKPVEAPAPKASISSFEAQDAALASDPSWMSGLLDED